MRKTALILLLISTTAYAGVKIYINGVPLPESATITITSDGVDQPVADGSEIRISTNSETPTNFIDITPESLPTTVFESDKAYRLTKGVYSGLTLEGLSNVYLTATPDVLVAGKGGKFEFSVTVLACSEVTIDGITATGGNAGVGMYYSPNCTVKNCRFYKGLYWGIFTSFSDRSTIENNVCTASFQQHGIYLSNSSDQHTIRGNVCTGNAGAGIQLNGDKYSSQSNYPEIFPVERIDGVMRGNLIENNIIAGNLIGMNLDGVQDSIVRGNIMEGSLRLYQIDGKEPSSRNTIHRNQITILKETHGLWLRDLAMGNVITENTIEISSGEEWAAWSFPISYTTNCEFTESNNVLIAPNAIGGGSNGKTAETTTTSLHVKKN